MCPDEHPRHETPFVERRDICVLGALVAAPAGNVGDEASGIAACALASSSSKRIGNRGKRPVRPAR